MKNTIQFTDSFDRQCLEFLWKNRRILFDRTYNRKSNSINGFNEGYTKFKIKKLYEKDGEIIWDYSPLFIPFILNMTKKMNRNYGSFENEIGYYCDDCEDKIELLKKALKFDDSEPQLLCLSMEMLNDSINYFFNYDDGWFTKIVNGDECDITFSDYVHVGCYDSLENQYFDTNDFLLYQMSMMSAFVTHKVSITRAIERMGNEYEEIAYDILCDNTENIDKEVGEDEIKNAVRLILKDASFNVFVTDVDSIMKHVNLEIVPKETIDKDYEKETTKKYTMDKKCISQICCGIRYGLHSQELIFHKFLNNFQIMSKE